MATNSENYSVGQMRLYWRTINTAIATQVDSIMGAINLASPLLYNAYDLGNVTAGEITPEVTYLDHFVSKAGKRFKDKTVAIMTSLSVPITLDEFTSTNLGHFFGTAGPSNRMRVFKNDSIPAEGCAVLLHYTDTGRDWAYVIPKAALRTEGTSISMNAEDWETIPMSLEVLDHTTYYPPGAAAASLAPFGYLNMTATTNEAPGA